VVLCLKNSTGTKSYDLFTPLVSFPENTGSDINEAVEAEGNIACA
jgi:hypothetical protein